MLNIFKIYHYADSSYLAIFLSSSFICFFILSKSDISSESSSPEDSALLAFLFLFYFLFDFYTFFCFLCYEIYRSFSWSFSLLFTLIPFWGMPVFWYAILINSSLSPNFLCFYFNYFSAYYFYFSCCIFCFSLRSIFAFYILCSFNLFYSL